MRAASGTKQKRSLFHRAFFNQYNLIALGGAGLFALTTFSWVPLLIGLGAEALWLTLGADSSFFRRWVAVQEGLEAREELAQRTAEALGHLEPHYLRTFSELERISDEIQSLARASASLETRLIEDEMNKLGRLLSSYLEMALLHQRLARYLEINCETDIQRDIAECERALAEEPSREVQATLRQSLALAQKRMRQHANLQATFRAVSVKMDTLEKSFRYLNSHIIAIGNQGELSTELDELILGVASVEQLTLEAEVALGLPGPARARAAQAAQKTAR